MRVALAVRGVGGPMTFLGASKVLDEDASLLIFEAVDDEPRMLRAAALGPDIGVFILLRPPVINGCLIAFVGFSRRSGSQIRHFAMKSTKSASSHRRT
jgi:hypothetical protein